MDDVWIVSGFMRSGTSMMMHCLGLGGMKIAENEAMDKTFRKNMGSEDYDPNPLGFHELVKELLNASEFPNKYVGKVVKVLASERLRELPSGLSYKVCFMVRNPIEIRESILKVKHGVMPERMERILSRYEQNVMFHSVGLNYRTDASCILVDYNKLLSDPLKQFEMLKREGWPIDPNKAVGGVDLKHYRHRMENLECSGQQERGVVEFNQDHKDLS